MATMGRPYIYKPEYCQMLTDHLATGKSYSSFGAGICCAASLHVWEEKFPEFKAAKEEGLRRGLDFFETLLRAKMTNLDYKVQGKTKSGKKDVDITALIFTLKTRFHKDYGDKTKHELLVSTSLEDIIAGSNQPEQIAPVQEKLSSSPEHDIIQDD